MANRLESILILNALQKDIRWPRFQELLTLFKTTENIVNQSESTLSKFFTKRIAHLISHWSDKFDLDEEIKLIEQNNITVLAYDHPNFPPSLLEIPDPPLLLYCKGTLLPQDQRALGIVGSRRATIYGTKTTLNLAQQMAQKNWTIVSGLAWGIDTHAHKGALQAKGRTLAVIGQGLATPLFPPDNESLAEQICQHGAMLSEFPMNFAPLPRNFPQRNRIISGLSKAVLVVEAAKRSGAFITADFALEQGKPVLAIPGPIDSKVSEGPNLLIQQGAKCVTQVGDIIEELESPLFKNNINEELPLNSSPPGLSDQEKMVWENLSNEEVYLEQLINNTGLKPNQTIETLLTLEIKNLVKQLPGQYYVKL